MNRGRPPGRRWFPILVLAFACWSESGFAKKPNLEITSDPSGATVEMDGIEVGKTPYSTSVPESYFKSPRLVTSRRLRHHIIVRVLMDGYVTKQIELTYGPIPIVNLNGAYFGDSWLLKQHSFHVSLEKSSDAFSGNPLTTLSASSGGATLPEMSIEEVVRRASPAVLRLSSGKASGTGFLITDTGVLVTNAHVTESETALVATSPLGAEFEVKVVYTDNDLDIALLKAAGTGFPCLRLGDVAGIRQGQTVVTIGNPGKGMPNSVTRGIVSAIGKEPGYTGTWIQTDAAINPGNSGGPLLNVHGEVIGITTQKPFLSSDGRPLQGIGFALSSGDLMAVLRRFYPGLSAPGQVAAQSEPPGTGTISVSCDPEGAELYVDDKFVGNSPAVLKLSAGTHSIELKLSGHVSWRRELEVLKDSQLSVKPTLEHVANQP